MDNLLISLVRPIRFERTASTSGVLRSILLSYGRMDHTLAERLPCVNGFRQPHPLCSSFRRVSTMTDLIFPTTAP
jgi:hypothetical protein